MGRTYYYTPLPPCRPGLRPGCCGGAHRLPAVFPQGLRAVRSVSYPHLLLCCGLRSGPHHGRFGQPAEDAEHVLVIERQLLPCRIVQQDQRPQLPVFPHGRAEHGCSNNKVLQIHHMVYQCSIPLFDYYRTSNMSYCKKNLLFL